MIENTTPAREGYAQPAEWAPHEATWLAWPSDAELWEDDLAEAQREFTELCRAIAWAPKGAEPERLDILVPDEANEKLASKALEGLNARLHRVPFGDIWVRDTAPIFLLDAKGQPATVRFAFNGWGGKYVLEHDDKVAEKVAALAGQPEFGFSWILEGGSVEVDGEGTCLTTRQCLLNPNRNPEMDQMVLEFGLCEALGVKRILWLDNGLLNDHTDGHIDTLARFVAPGVVMCMQAQDADDPNKDVLEGIAAALERMTDARGRKLRVVRVPSPGRVTDEDGRVMPASYANFYIANHSVVVPTYGTKWDEAAVKAIAELFPNHRTVGVGSKAILTGGGSFHCITQQQPKAAQKE